MFYQWAQRHQEWKREPSTPSSQTFGKWGLLKKLTLLIHHESSRGGWCWWWRWQWLYRPIMQTRERVEMVKVRQRCHCRARTLLKCESTGIIMWQHSDEKLSFLGGAYGFRWLWNRCIVSWMPMRTETEQMFIWFRKNRSRRINGHCAQENLKFPHLTLSSSIPLILSNVG